MKYIYDIKNVKTGNVEYRGMTAGEVQQAIGIDRSAIAGYVARNTVYKGQYSIILVGMADGWETRFADEWERARQRLLRAAGGGKKKMKVTIAGYERTGGITQADIEKIRKKVKIGDKIRVWTLKAVDVESVGSRTKAFRRGMVVAKFPRFAVVEFAGGVRDSVLRADLLRERRKA